MKKPNTQTQKNWARSRRRQMGQSLVEYLLLTAIIGIGTFGMVRITGQAINGKLAEVASVLQGNRRPSFRPERINQDDLKKKDMRDFMNGATSRD